MQPGLMANSPLGESRSQAVLRGGQIGARVESLQGQQSAGEVVGAQQALGTAAVNDATVRHALTQQAIAADAELAQAQALLGQHLGRAREICRASMG